MTKDYTENYHRVTKIKNNFLLINDIGDWALLTKENYHRFLTGKLTEKKYSYLEKSNIIITKRNIQKIINDTREYYAYLFRATSRHRIITCGTCNNRCAYCYASPQLFENKLMMSRKTAKKVIDLIFKFPEKTITIEFHGGECLLNFEIIKFIVAEVTKLNKRFKRKITYSLTTNLSILTQEMVDFFKKYKFICVSSLDGPKALHDQQRKSCSGEGTYENIIKNLKLAESNGLNFDFITTITKNSLKYHEEIVDEFVKINKKYFFLRPVKRKGFANDNWESTSCLPEEYFDFWKKYLDILIKKTSQGELMDDNLVCILLKKIIFNNRVNYMPLRNPCGLSSIMTYNYNGDIIPCCENRDEIMKIGNVNSTSWVDIVSSQKLSCLINKTLLENHACDMCAYKPYCGICLNNNYDPSRKRFRVGQDKMICDLYKMQFNYLFEKILFDKDAREIFKKWLLYNPKTKQEMKDINFRECFVQFEKEIRK
jgi:uncharacterized protein